MENNKISKELFDPVKENKKKFADSFGEKLAEVFPSAVKDGEVDFKALLAELGEYVDSSERYELTWAGKVEAKRIANTDVVAKTLKYIPEDSKDMDTTENLYIEGDNLEVLKLLRNSYYNKIKMIYIDPPYNTGNDLIYKDKFSLLEKDVELLEGDISEDERYVVNQKGSGKYHSNWLSMMYPRLKVSKDLLTEDGIIFISIDNNEVHNLRKLCDDVFGEENFIEQIVWKNKYGSGAQTRGFIEVHEYILCYSKHPILNLTSELNESERKKYVKKDEKFETLGGYRTQPLMTKSLGDRENLMYSIYYKGVEIFPDKQWVWSKERLEQAIKDNRVEFREKNDGTYSVEAKKYLYDEEGNIRRGKPISILNGPFNQDGTKENRELFNGKTPFDFTKPSDLIKYLIKIEINNNKDNDFIVLDFFSGSSTTADAVMQLNAEDGGKRKFVMIQYPEITDEKTIAYKEGYNNICEIGKERIRRAGDKIKEENKDKEGIENLDIGFKVFKVEDTNIRWFSEAIKTDKITLDESMMSDKDKLDFNPGYTDIDVVYEILLRHRDIPLSATVEHLKTIGERTYMFADAIVVCLDEVITEEMIDSIAAIEPMPTKIIFRDSAFEANISLKENTMLRLQAQIKKQSRLEKKAYRIEFI